MKTIIKNAKAVLPNETKVTDVLVENGKIAKIESECQIVADETIDANGLYLIPGVIDDQVHFREPGLTGKEDLLHASRACAKGGVTSFLEMPNTVPNTITKQALHDKLELASEKCVVNYGFYIGATTENIAELQSVARTPGIKIFIGSSTGNLLVDEQAALEQIFAETDLPICAHCEDETTVRRNAEKWAGSTDIKVHSRIRNHEAALIATRRAIDLALRHNHPFHVLHVSTAAEIAEIRNAGNLISAEVCPHHLLFNVDDYERLGSLVKMNPSIKLREDNEALWAGLLSGDIQVVATDHAPHTMDEKKLPFPQCPSGLPAIENSLALMLNQVNSGRCTIEQVVNWMCTQPARVWNIKNKGSLQEGFDADLALVDMSRDQAVENERQLTKCKWSPWNGEILRGWPVKTWVMGTKVFDFDMEDQWVSNDPVGHEIEYSR